MTGELTLAPTVLGTLTTQSAINAGRVQAVNNVPTLTASAMATSAGTGAAVGGLFYTGPIAADAAWQLTWNGTPFFETFSPQFSSDKFVGSLAIGAVGGFAVNTALFNMGLPTRLIPSLQTVEGQVLRTNAVVGSVGGNQAWRAYVDHRDGQNNQPSPNAQQESSQHDTTEDGP